MCEARPSLPATATAAEEDRLPLALWRELLGARSLPPGPVDPQAAQLGLKDLLVLGELVFAQLRELIVGEKDLVGAHPVLAARRSAS